MNTLTSEETHEIFKRLGGLEAKAFANGETLKAFAKIEEERGARMDKILDRHDKLILGNNGTPGMKIDLDRLKQSHRFYTWLVKGTLMASVTAVAGIIIGAIF